MKDEHRPTVEDLLDLATDFNEIIEGIGPTDEPIGHFSVAPFGYGGGGITFESWGPSWCEDSDERPDVDPSAVDPDPIPLREHLISEMEKLGRGILEFVVQARRTGACETCAHYEGGMDTWGHCPIKDIPRQDGDWCEDWLAAEEEAANTASGEQEKEEVDFDTAVRRELAFVEGQKNTLAVRQEITHRLTQLFSDFEDQTPKENHCD